MHGLLQGEFEGAGLVETGKAETKVQPNNCLHLLEREWQMV